MPGRLRAATLRMTAIGITAPPAGRVRNAAEQFLCGGSDNAATLRVLALFVIAWTAFQTTAYSSVALHPDLTEVFAWSQHPSASYSKHPPLSALMVHAWFLVFPVADWSYHMLAMTNAAIGLFFTDLIARRYLDRDKRIFVLLLLMLTPFYQFHGQRFASSQTLISTWPLATWCFLKSFERRGIVWPIAAGVAAALAMLGKYYSIYLIAAFPLAVAAHRDGLNYLRSPAPWISATAGFLALSPHLIWLASNGLQTFSYAFSVHGDISSGKALIASGKYLVGLIAYAALPLAGYWIAVRPARPTIRDVLAPSDPERRMLLTLFLVPLLLPAIVAPLLHTSLKSLWTMQAWFLLPILLLAPRSAVLPRDTMIATAICIFMATIAIVAAAPIIAWRYQPDGIRQDRSYSHLLAAEVTRKWRGRFGTKLSIVTGEPGIASATTFYSSEHPDFLAAADLWASPWVTAERAANEGAAIVCRADQQIACEWGVRALGATAQALHKTEITLASHYLGSTTRPQKFLMWFLPPDGR